MAVLRQRIAGQPVVLTRGTGHFIGSAASPPSAMSDGDTLFDPTGLLPYQSTPPTFWAYEESDTLDTETNPANATSGSNYAAFTSTITPQTPVTIDTIRWEIGTADDYTLELGGVTIGIQTSSGSDTITFSGINQLITGLTSLKLTPAAGPHTWRYQTAPPPLSTGTLTFGDWQEAPGNTPPVSIDFYPTVFRKFTGTSGGIRWVTGSYAGSGTGGYTNSISLEEACAVVFVWGEPNSALVQAWAYKGHTGLKVPVSGAMAEQLQVSADGLSFQVDGTGNEGLDASGITYYYAALTES